MPQDYVYSKSGQKRVNGVVVATLRGRTSRLPTDYSRGDDAVVKSFECRFDNVCTDI